MGLRPPLCCTHHQARDAEREPDMIAIETAAARLIDLAATYTLAATDGDMYETIMTVIGDEIKEYALDLVSGEDLTVEIYDGDLSIQQINTTDMIGYVTAHGTWFANVR